MYTIYKATNTQTGKSYIGFDSSWPKRKKQHKRISETNPRYHFHKAIQKYGWDAFIWEILFEGWDLSFTKDYAETYFIHEHNTFEEGYNSTRGGEGGTGYKHTPEARAKIKKSQTESNSMAGKTPWNKNKSMSIETRQKLSNAHKGRKSPKKGIPMSDEQRQKLSDYYKGRPKSEEWKKSRRGHTPWNKGKKGGILSRLFL
jgi:group I intron endonuclease